MEDKKPLNVSDDIKTELITKMILIKLIENYSFSKVVDIIIKREKEENELAQVINIIKQKNDMSKLTKIIFDLEDLYKITEENFDKKEEKGGNIEKEDKKEKMEKEEKEEKEDIGKKDKISK